MIILSIDRLARELAAESESIEIPQKDLRRFKTVARMLPQLELGQEDG